VFECRAMAVLPNGSQRLVQTLVGPTIVSFPSALTMHGSSMSFATTTSANFFVRGNDQYNPPGSCVPSTGTVTALGYTGGSNSDFLQPSNPSGIPAGLVGNYTKDPPPPPPTTLSLGPVTVLPAMQTVGNLNHLVQLIEQYADVSPFSGMGQLSDANNFMPAAMSATNPMTIVVNDDLIVNGWHHHGYGLLLVTGELTFDPDAYWHGIVMVIGKGMFHAYQNSSTGGHIEGELFIARTLNSSGSPLPASSAPGVAHFDFTGATLTPSGSNYYGVYYSSCWVQASTPGYQVLSFHEISQ